MQTAARDSGKENPGTIVVGYAFEFEIVLIGSHNNINNIITLKQSEEVCQ